MPLKINPLLTAGLDLSPATISVTVAQLQSAISGGSLVPDTTYIVTDPANGGVLYLKSTSSSKISQRGSWIKNTNLTGFGWIRLTGGGAGSVNSLTVNGVNQMTTSVSYTTSLANTASLVAANINANASATYSALVVNDSIVVYQKTASSSANGHVVAATTTTITTGDTKAISNGVNPTSIVLDITYDSASDRITSCYDPIWKNTVTTRPAHANALRRISDFRWGDDVYQDNVVDEGDMFDNFFVTTGSVINNRVDRLGRIRTNIGASNNYIYGNVVSGEFGYIGDNQLLGVWAVATPQISLNICLGSLSGNLMKGNGPTIYSNKILTGTSNGIFSNTFTGSLAPTISYNVLMHQTNINGNTLSAPKAYISDNIMSGRQAAIINNVLSGGSNENGIRGNIISGNGSLISGNTVTSTVNDTGIQRNILSGNGSLISGNTISGGAGITNNTFSGQSSGFTNNSTPSAVSGLIFEATNAKYDSVTFDVATGTITGIEWTADNRIIFNLIRTGLTNTAGNGATGSDIILGVLPANKAYPIRSVVEGSSITSGGAAQIKIGIATDDDDCIMASTAYSSITSPALTTVTMTKSAAVNRNIVAAVTGAAVTGGSIQVSVEFKISNF